jgi:hypothetical protein
MPENALQFNLGLQSAGFLSALSGAMSGLTRFVGIAGGMGGLMAGVWSRIEKGAKLEDLSARTGETVKDLFLLQRGFELAGISAEAVPMALFRIQKALGGISDTGEPTGKIFAQLGLSIEQLKGMAGAEKIEALVKALAGMNRAGASFAASKIFGRGEAKDMMQLVGKTEEFARALRVSAADAEFFQKNSKAMEELTDNLTVLKWKLMEGVTKAKV